MLQTSNLVRKYKQICGFKRCQHFFCKKLAFFLKSSTFTQSCVRDSFVLFSVFVRQKVTLNGNVSFTDYTSGFRLLNCSKLTVNLKNDNDITNSNITPSPNFFDVACSFFSSLVTGPSFTSISLLVLEL